VRREKREDAAAAYRQLITDFLAVYSLKDQHQGYPAFEGEQIADGARMLAEHKLLVFVEAVLCNWPQRNGGEAAPSLRFLVCRNGSPNGEIIGGFAVETELVIEALENAYPSTGDLQIPLPAVEVPDPARDSVAAGDPRYLRISLTQIEPGPGTCVPRLPAGGIRFAVGGTEDGRTDPPAYSFAMAGLTPFLALNAAMVQYSGPSSLVLELEELRQEIERTPEG